MTLTRRAFLTSLCIAALVGFSLIGSGCGWPAHIDPPIYSFTKDGDAERAATAHVAQLAEQGHKGLKLFVLDTHSMEPLMFGGDWLVVDTSEPFANLRAGQVITYWAEWNKVHVPVTHRILTVHREGLLMGGDDAPTEVGYRATKETYVGLAVGIYTTRTRPKIA